MSRVEKIAAGKVEKIAAGKEKTLSAAIGVKNDHKNNEKTTVRIPQTPIASPLIAPSVSPSSIALDVPTAWLQAPMLNPAAIGSFTRNRRIR